jgi:formylglycine-generating enzyme required for sulfatase activity
MNQFISRIIFTVVALTLILTACVPATPQPTPTAPSATPEPATALPPTSTPTLVPAPLAGPQAGASMKWVDAGRVMFVPAGEFVMGTGAGDSPTHPVSLDAFWIHETEVTNGMYAQCVAAGACTPPTQELGAPVITNLQYNSHPVVGVDWDQASAYCAWIQGSLPTEAQWEKAARGSVGGTYPWGEDGTACDLLNFAGCVRHTTAVTEYKNGRSPYGLFDMAGNVFEWVQDWYGEDYYSNSPSTNPTGPESGEQRIIRSSSFESDPDQVAVGLRHPAGAGYHSAEVGFRCVVMDPKPLAPYCQLNAYIPSVSALPQGACQVPDAQVRGNYCTGGDGFVTFNVADGADYQVNRDDYECSEAFVDGKRLVTCRGPRTTETSMELTVCNPTCSSSPDVTGATPVCDSGYALDSNGACIYSPVSSEPGVAGCPLGYVVIDRGAQKVCAPGRGGDGQCPAGLYYDDLYSACVSPNGSADIPYGIDNPDLAAQSFQGCAAGYEYDPAFQCCQAVTGGTYPGCTTGSTYDPVKKVCIPDTDRIAGPGCVTLVGTTLQCSEPIDVCSKITVEVACRKNAYACQWDERAGICEMKKK